MFERGQRPPRRRSTAEERQTAERQQKNFSGEGEGHRADGESGFWSGRMSRVNNATESARSMAREVEEGETYGDSPKLIKGHKADLHAHLDVAEEALAEAKNSVERDIEKRESSGGEKRRGWLW